MRMPTISTASTICARLNRLMGQPIPLWADAETLAEIRRRFGYVLEPVSEPGRYYKPTLAPHEISGRFAIGGVDIVPFAQDHGFSTTLGLRIGPMAYSTDVTALDDDAFAAIAGVELWIVDCMRRAPHPTHSHLATDARLDRAGKPAARRLDPYGPDASTIASSAPNCPPASSPARTGWSSSCRTDEAIPRTKW